MSWKGVRLRVGVEGASCAIACGSGSWEVVDPEYGNGEGAGSRVQAAAPAPNRAQARPARVGTPLVPTTESGEERFPRMGTAMDADRSHTVPRSSRPAPL